MPARNLIRLGTYNVNNFFDRFDDPYSYSDDPWRRLYAAKPKKLSEQFDLGERIRKSKVDILALQEIESLGSLREFVQGHLGSTYRTLDGVISVEGNDPRGIDLGVVSMFRLGKVTSHRFRRHSGSQVFSRDCLEVEVMRRSGSGVLLTLYVCHLKSRFSTSPIGTAAWERDTAAGIAKRKRQVAHTIEIVGASQDVDNDAFAILGDMNDTPDSEALQDFIREDNPLGVHNALSDIPQDDPSPESTVRRPRDTHKWEKDTSIGHNQTTYSQLDFIFLSHHLKQAYTGKSKAEQRGNTTGSDHYLCWVELDLDRL